MTRIADAANGDARGTITALRIAARRIEQSSEAKITRDIVADALPQARQELREAYIDGLTHHQQAVFEIIGSQGRIGPSDLSEAYRENVDEPKSNRTIRNYLNKLERYNLITAEGSTLDRVYRPITHRQPGYDSTIRLSPVNKYSRTESDRHPSLQP